VVVVGAGSTGAVGPAGTVVEVVVVVVVVEVGTVVVVVVEEAGSLPLNTKSALAVPSKAVLKLAGKLPAHR